ncbi:ATP-grasp domain-containing protein [Streptomyces nondiastaticus]|uniref:ATP-grasp domain-containing protein n=1 Tax=Streptomyces nondiastaticus TaxID=3154512 RepID=A0ABW6U443_9ACTN
MPSAQPRVLYVTDLAYPARGRRYCDEDIFLSSRLREDFDVALCHPLDAAALMDAFDAVVVRNSGPVLHYQAAYDDFARRAAEGGVRVYNQLTGKADMAGKQYLLDLTAAGHPVIPTVDRAEDTGLLPAADEYVVKPKLGADSIGLRFVPREELADLSYDGVLVQPRIRFRYEVSFYFVDDAFQYALHAPDPGRRWELVPYEPTAEDLAFAQRFVEWNGIEHGIQRVDACRAPGGELLLVELEDLNPYLSLDLVAPETRDAFVAAFKTALHRLLES